MTEFLPFKGIIYDNHQVKGSDVLAPPYDIISPQKKNDLYGKSEYNVVRIDFGKELHGDDDATNKYVRSAQYLSQWLSEGVLLRRNKESFYIYEAEYQHRGEKLRLRGMIGRLKLVELGKGVYPHEETHSAPKKDRLEIMRVCKANVSPIFALYNSPERTAASTILDAVADEPYMEATDDLGVVHRMWIVDDKSAIERISSDVRNSPVYIADGHHRYETAIAYQKEMNEIGGKSDDAPYNYVMMFLVNMADEGITILPTHRLVPQVPENMLGLLENYFEVLPIRGDEEIIRALSQFEHALGMCLHGDERFYVLKTVDPDIEAVNPVLRELDVVVLHKLILKKLLNIDIITYEMDASRCIHLVKSGEYGAAFFLNPTRVEEIERVSLNFLRMPPKSTYFYPKLLTGFVMNPFE